MHLVSEDIEAYAKEHSQEEGNLLLSVTKDTYQSLDCPQMLCGRLEGRLLKLLALLVGARRILEIGTFSGYSALSMAEALPEDGELITCDLDPTAIATARSNFAKSPHGSKITQKTGPGLQTIKTLDGPFDMVFIDADKENYPNYYDAVFDKVRSGGLIVVDNVLWSGGVLDPQTDCDRAIHALNERVKADDRVDQVLVTMRDGIFVIRKR